MWVSLTYLVGVGHLGIIDLRSRDGGGGTVLYGCH